MFLTSDYRKVQNKYSTDDEAHINVIAEHAFVLNALEASFLGRLTLVKLLNQALTPIDVKRA